MGSSFVDPKAVFFALSAAGKQDVYSRTLHAANPLRSARFTGTRLLPADSGGCVPILMAAYRFHVPCRDKHCLSGIRDECNLPEGKSGTGARFGWVAANGRRLDRPGGRWFAEQTRTSNACPYTTQKTGRCRALTWLTAGGRVCGRFGLILWSQRLLWKKGGALQSESAQAGKARCADSLCMGTDN